MAGISQLEINGTTYDICDATARDSLSNYLPLTGGELTGTTKMIGKYIYCKETNIDRDAAAPSTATYGNSRFAMQDNNDEILGEMRPVYQTNGMISLQFAVYNESTSGDQVQNWMQLNVYKDGTQTYSIASPSAFRDALGDVPYTVSGTTATQSAISNVRFSAQSNSNQVIRIYADSYDGTYAFCINKTNPFLYDSTNSQTLYSCLTTAMAESTIRSAAGLPDYLQTWTTVTGANWITPASGWTIESDTAIRVNTVLKIAHVYYHATRTTGNSSAQNETIGTLKSAYAGANGSCFGSFTSAAYSYYLSGTTTLKANLAANTKTVYCAGLYKLA